MGGSVATLLAARNPNLVEMLILAEPMLSPVQELLSAHIAAQDEQRYRTRGHSALMAMQHRMAAEGDTGAAVFAGTLALASPVAMHRAARVPLPVASGYARRDDATARLHPRGNIVVSRGTRGIGVRIDDRRAQRRSRDDGRQPVRVRGRAGCRAGSGITSDERRALMAPRRPSGRQEWQG